MAQLQRTQQRRQRTRRGLIAGAIAVAVIGGLAIYYSTRGSSSKVTTSSTTAAASTSTTTAARAAAALPCPKADGSSPRTITFPASPPNCLTAGKTYTATFVTNEGNITVALDTKKTPGTVNNFVYLARYHYYDGTRIFRTDTSIDIIQGGSPHTESASDPGPGYTIKDEGSGYTYAAGDLVMARTSQPNSAGAEYFFCTGPKCANLNSQGTYVVFGHTTAGLSVLQKIIGLSSGSGALGGSPRVPVTVEKVTITES